MIQIVSKIILTCFCLVLCHMENGHSQSSNFSQFVLYLEGPSDVSKDITLELDYIELTSEDNSIVLNPKKTVLNSYQHANQQISLIEQLVQTRKYDKITFYFSKIIVIADRAKIYPTIDTSGYTIDINLEFSPKTSTVLFVKWNSDLDFYNDKTYMTSFMQNFQERAPIGSVFYVSNSNSNNISVVDRRSYKVIDVISTGETPQEMIYNQFNNQLIVSNTTSNSLSIIDLTTNKLIKSIDLDYSDKIKRTLLSPDQRSLFILNGNSNSLLIIDMNNYQERDRIFFNNTPIDMAVNQITGRLYIIFEFSRELTVYDTYMQRIVNNYQLPSEASYIAVNNQSESIYYASSTQRSISQFSISGNSNNRAIHICDYATDIIYDNALQTLYASIPDCNEIAILKPNQNIELSSIKTSGRSDRITIDNNKKLLFVPISKSNKLEIYNMHNRKKVAEIEVGNNPYFVLVP